MNKLEYVISGTSLTRLPTSNFAGNPKLVEAAKKAFKLDYNEDDISKVSMLYNAFTEKNFLPNLEKADFYGSDWMVDSGGLQIMSQGKTLTNELKQNIYQTQSDSNSLSMSFDEMPLIVKEGIADTRTDLSTKKFIASMIDEKATESGKNLLQQLRVFEKNNSSSKAMIIVQGNKIDDFHHYFYRLLEQIPKELYSYIGGVAMAGSCCGIGTLESCNTIAAYCTMDIPAEFNNKIHFLGFGSISRLLPAVQFLKNGMLTSDVSYDSSSHSSKYFIGGGYTMPGNKSIEYGKTRNRNSDIILNEIFSKYGQVIEEYWNVDRKEWVNICSEDLTTSKKFHQEDKKKAELCLLNVFFNCLGSVKNFTNELETYIVDDRLEKNRSPLYFLKDVKNIEDYNHWMNEFHLYISSKKIERFENLENYNLRQKDITSLF